MRYRSALLLTLLPMLVGCQSAATPGPQPALWLQGTVVLAELPINEALAAGVWLRRDELERFCFPGFDGSRPNHVERLSCNIPDLAKLLRAWEQTFDLTVLSHPAAALVVHEPADLHLWTQQLVNADGLTLQHHLFSDWRLRATVIGRRDGAAVVALAPRTGTSTDDGDEPATAPAAVVIHLKPGQVVGVRGLFPLVIQSPADGSGGGEAEGKLVDVVVFLSLGDGAVAAR